MIASAINRDLFDSLIRDEREGKPISPAKFTLMMAYDLRELEERALVPTRTADNDPHSPQLQAYMSRSMHVIDSLLSMQLSTEQALFWFQCAMITEFDNQSPQALAAKDCAEEVISCLRKVFVTQRDTMAPLWEQMREETLSVQADILRDVKMLTVGEVAAICGVDAKWTMDMDLDLARSLASQGTMFFVTKGGKPLFPAYQFGSKGPKPIVAGVLKILAPGSPAGKSLLGSGEAMDGLAAEAQKTA
jgi:hypothetical protein